MIEASSGRLFILWNIVELSDKLFHVEHCRRVHSTANVSRGTFDGIWGNETNFTPIKKTSRGRLY
jgi:hypothetical protein